MEQDSNFTYEDGDIFACQPFDFSMISGVLIILITIVSVVGNVLLMFVLFAVKKLYLVTKIFIINLACSDLIFTATLPFWAVYHLHQWIFGEFLCKFIVAAYFTGLYSSIIVLTVMTVERFFTVVLNNWPNNNVRKKQFAVSACVVAWIISVGTSVYEAFKMEIHDGYCEPSYSDDLGYYFQIALLFFVPFAIIIFCHCAIINTILHSAGRSSHKALSMVFCIVVAYIICWGPYNILLLIMHLYQPTVCKEQERLDSVYRICRIIAFSHCCLNPLLLMLTQKFRRHLLCLWKCKVADMTNRGRTPDHNMSCILNGITDVALELSNK